jgi:hypothetical protein
MDPMSASTSSSSSANDSNVVTVHARWAPQGGFFLWGARRNGGICDAYDLRDWLFAWHEPSFYGTFVEIIESQNIEGLLLPPLEALDYLVRPGIVQHQKLELTRELRELIQLAPHVKESLTQGRCMPDGSCSCLRRRQPGRCCPRRSSGWTG